MMCKPLLFLVILVAQLPVLKQTNDSAIVSSTARNTISQK